MSASGSGCGAVGLDDSRALLAQLHAERLARRPPRLSYHTLQLPPPGSAHFPGSSSSSSSAPTTQLAVVEHHGAQLGSSLWHAALPFAEWLLVQPLWAVPRRILELGAGCGSSGIACAVVPPVSVVASEVGVGHTLVLTDKDEVCENLQRNVSANAAALSAAGASVHVRPLRWGSTAANNPSAAAEWQSVMSAAGGGGGGGGGGGSPLAFDLVLASECVYELPLLDALMDVIAQALRQPEPEPAEEPPTTGPAEAAVAVAAEAPSPPARLERRAILGFCR
jgi:predicted nicotinamide N-methyase